MAVFPGSFLASFPLSKFHATISFGILGLLYALYTRYATPLRKVPGPILASITKLWIVKQQRNFLRHFVDMDLHKKYGAIVRIAPNEVMVSSPQAFKTIYGAGTGFPKGDWYIGTTSCGWNGPDNLSYLGEKNMEKYRIQRRATGPAYTENAMKDFEPNIDTALKKGIDTMHKRAGESVDLDIFFNFFASDCISMATLSRCNELIKAGKDNGSVRGVHNAWKYMHWIGYFPLLHRFITWLFHSPIRLVPFLSKIGRFSLFFRRDAAAPENPFTLPITELKTRYATKQEKSVSKEGPPADIAAKLLQLQAEKGVLTDSWVTSMCMTNYGAGIETTAITISTLINFIVSQNCQERVQEEIDNARKEGKLSNPPKLREMRDHLPYLTACLNESMRLHPVVGMPLVRTVPEGGCELEGYFLPAGTQVGINSWIITRDKSLYGDDADIWRPERWLEYTPEQLKQLETYSVFFGTGARSCPGKYLAQAVYTKMLPMLFGDFEWSYTEPEAEKRTQCTFSVRYMELTMQWKERSKAE